MLKSEPSSYGWNDLVRDGAAEWDGIRNAAARLHLKAMAAGDTALLYHSGKDKAAVAIVEITRSWRPEGAEGDWASVAVAPVRALTRPVTLAAMKADMRLTRLEMLRQGRLSVSPVRDDEWAVLLELGAD